MHVGGSPVANGFAVVPTVTKPSPTPVDGGTTYTHSLLARAVHPHDAAFVSTAALIVPPSAVNARGCGDTAQLQSTSNSWAPISYAAPCGVATP